MRSQLLIGGVMITATALLAWSGMAKADHPQQGAYVNNMQPMFSCDSREQIEQIAAAKLQSDAAADAKFAELHAIQDKNGEATCMFGKLLAAVAVGESFPLPDLKFDDTVVKAYAIHVGTSRSEWWIMFIDPTSLKKETSI